MSLTLTLLLKRTPKLQGPKNYPFEYALPDTSPLLKRLFKQQATKGAFFKAN